mgnify:CR=1 FL=1
MSDILDIGCGVGTISLLLASWGNKVEGIDISSIAIDSCKNSAKLLNLEKNINFKQFDFKDYKENKKFDFIICLEVIEHLENDREALQKMFTFLKPSGKLIAVSYTHLRAHETVLDLVCRLLLEKKKQ